MKKRINILIFAVFVILSGCNVKITPLDAVNTDVTEEITSLSETETSQIPETEETTETSALTELTELTEETTTVTTEEAYTKKDGFFTGKIKEAAFYHDGRQEWITYCYVDVGYTQYSKIKDNTDDFQDLGQTVETEIQLYSADDNINLSEYVGKTVEFDGFWFAAETIYHRRNIVFGVQEIHDISGSLGGDYSPRDERFCAVWMAMPFVAAGYDTTYFLYADGTFHYACSEMDGLDRIRHEFGIWYIESGGNSDITLCLNIQNRAFWSGGREVPAEETDIFSTSAKLVDYTIEYESYYDETVMRELRLSSPEYDDETGKSTILIDGVKFYAFGYD